MNNQILFQNIAKNCKPTETKLETLDAFLQCKCLSFYQIENCKQKTPNQTVSDFFTPLTKYLSKHQEITYQSLDQATINSLVGFYYEFSQILSDPYVSFDNPNRIQKVTLYLRKYQITGLINRPDKQTIDYEKELSACYLFDFETQPIAIKQQKPTMHKQWFDVLINQHAWQFKELTDQLNQKLPKFRNINLQDSKQTTITWADALNHQIGIENLTGFDREEARQFAKFQQFDLDVMQCCKKWCSPHLYRIIKTQILKYYKSGPYHAYFLDINESITINLVSYEPNIDSFACFKNKQKPIRFKTKRWLAGVLLTKYVDLKNKLHNLNAQAILTIKDLLITQLKLNQPFEIPKDAPTLFKLADDNQNRIEYQTLPHPKQRYKNDPKLNRLTKRLTLIINETKSSQYSIIKLNRIMTNTELFNHELYSIFKDNYPIGKKLDTGELLVFNLEVENNHKPANPNHNCLILISQKNTEIKAVEILAHRPVDQIEAFNLQKYQQKLSKNIKTSV